MLTIFIIYIFIMGLLVGSFLNVVALRYNSGLSYRKGRSMCFSCGEALRWHDMVPVFSFLFLLGKCRQCKTKISWQYPVVELLSGLLFVGIFYRQYSLWSLYGGMQYGLLFSVLFFIFYVVVFSLLLVIGVYDIKHKIIPDKMVFAFIGLSLVKLFIFFVCNDFLYDLPNILNLLAPVLLSLPFALIWLLSSGRMMGLGDAKLIFGIGALLGFGLGLSAVILSFWIGCVWSVGLLIARRNKRKSASVGMNTEIPFAPFLILGTIIVFLTQADVLGVRALFSVVY